jgi:hypothetical protein
LQNIHWLILKIYPALLFHATIIAENKNRPQGTARQAGLSLIDLYGRAQLLL